MDCTMLPMHIADQIYVYSGDPEIGPPMGLTESGRILESVRFVKPATFEWQLFSLFTRHNGKQYV